MLPKGRLQSRIPVTTLAERLRSGLATKRWQSAAGSQILTEFEQFVEAKAWLFEGYFESKRSWLGLLVRGQFFDSPPSESE
jgi:hypothetical protein